MGTGFESRQSESKAYLYFILVLIIYLFLSFCLFWATPAAYGGSQVRGLIGAVAPGLHQQCRIQAVSATHTTACGKAGSSTD